MRFLCALLGVAVPLALLAADKPVPVAEAAGKMTAPPGFNVTLFAGEPDVVQPIAFTFDDRGRMWVVECVTYPKWLQPGQKGKDRVIILEDTDGDGRHDKKTVVLDDGVNLSGIELGFGGVYLCSTPNLIFVPLDGDKPSGPPQVLLDGWNLKDAKHNVFNSLVWGPDGWLYGCNGIQTKSWVGTTGTPQDKRTYIDAGVWKFHPTRKAFEVVATGTTNPWGLDFDERGEMFITNCVIDHLWHVVPGGRYERMYGQDSNPFAFGLMKSAVDYRHWAGGHWTDSRADKKTGALQKGHDDAGGGHAHSGCAIYLGDNFPAEYRNTLFTCNIHGSRLNNDGLERTPSGMKGVRRPDFLFANDPWFRGICVKQGPEGALYVSDWSDTGECHNYDVADTTNGRIYRIAYGTPKRFAGDVSNMTNGDLWKLHESKNEWLVRKARRVMLERIAAENEPQIAGVVPHITGAELKQLEQNPPPEYVQRQQFWTRQAAGFPLYYTKPMASETLRVWTAQNTPENNNRPAAVRPNDTHEERWETARLQELAKDPSPRVRMAVGGALARIKPEVAFWVAAVLCSHPEDNADANLSMHYWHGLQPAVMAEPGKVWKLFPQVRNSLVRTNIVRQVCSLPKSDPTEQVALVLPALEDAANDHVRRDILTGILAAFEDRKQVTAPAGWKKLYGETLAKSAVGELADEVGLKFGDETAITMLLFKATHHKNEPGRAKAVERLAPLKRPDLGIGAMLRSLLGDTEVRGAAVRGLSYHPDAATPAAILAAYPTFTPAEKADAIQTLASRKEFAAKLLDAVEAGTVPKADVSAFAARQIAALNDAGLRAKLGTVWGEVKPANQNRAAQTARLKALLTEEYVKAADIPAGKALFARQCAACHKLFGEGGDVGPELTGSQRANLDYLLENVLDPNAVVPSDYKMTAFAVSDGRTVTGLVKKETPQAVTVRTVNELLVLPVADIESRKATPNSVMPEGLLDPLTDAQVRDLLSYLMRK